MVSIVSSASALAWNDYQIIYWQQRNSEQLATLKRLGITAATVIANRDGSGTPVEQQYAPILANGLRWYVENIATDYYAAYHRWFPDKKVNWRFLDAQQRYRANPDDETLLWRDPSFTDPIWQQRIRDRLTATVREQSRFRPLYYSLGDETGIADLSASWDFDMSPASLMEMRGWLRQQYGSLDGLNAEWGTQFEHWDAVRPETTRQAIRRSDDNYAAWADFKAWMDVAFARALRMGTDAVHAADPAALAGIEGVMVPGSGGYDYSLLVDAVDVMETDDIPLARSLNPRLVTLHTSDRRGIHGVWQDLLEGSRGLIIWDSRNDVVRPDATLGERGQAYAALFAELRNGLGALLIAAEPQLDPVAILYSPASFRTQWMLDQKPKGDAWMSRDSEAEQGQHAVRDAMWAYRRTVMHLGLSPSYVTPAMLDGGELQRFRALILPHAIALSSANARVIADFVAGGGLVIADVQPGIFDEHSRRMPRSLLEPTMLHMIGPHALRISDLGVVPRFRVEAPNGDVTTHVWRHGDDMIISLQRDFTPSASTEAVTLILPQSAEVFDLRKQRPLGRVSRIELTLGSVQPALLSVK